MNKNNILLLLMITAAISSAFAAQPPVSAAAGVCNELDLVNETGSELHCVVAPIRASLLPVLPTVRNAGYTLRSPRSGNEHIETLIESGRTFSIINLQDNESVMVGGQLLLVDHFRLENNRCVIKVSRRYFGYGAISFSEPICTALSTKEIGI